MIEWEISFSPAKFKGYHIQARTKDQLCSFAVVVEDMETMYRGKTANGKGDVFTIMGPGGATMNVVGKIKYTGKWPKK